MGTLGMFETRSTHGQQSPAQARAVVAAGGIFALRIASAPITASADARRSVLVFGGARLLNDSTIVFEPFGVGQTLMVPTSQLYEARSITEPELRARGVLADMASSNRRHVAHGALVAFEATPSD